MTALSRRSFLVTAGAGAAAIAVAACSKDGSGSPATTAAGTGSGTAAPGDTVLVRFFNDGIQAAGLGQRLPFGLGNQDGVLVTGGPESLAFRILDAEGTQVTEATAARHATGLPRPYWPVELQLTAPGIYTAATTIDGKVATAEFSVRAPEEIRIPKPGDALIPVDTPTVADARGVSPICTRQPACPLHDVTLTSALATGSPVALLIGTPAYCQTAVCGPVLDVMLGLRGSHPTVTMVHAEVYKDPERSLSSGSTTDQGADLGEATEAVLTYQLDFEPVLYVAGADGKITARFDNIWDAEELGAALAKVS